MSNREPNRSSAEKPPLDTGRILDSLAMRFPVCMGSDEFHYFPQARAKAFDWSAWDDFSPDALSDTMAQLDEWLHRLISIPKHSPISDMEMDAAMLERVLRTLKEQFDLVRAHETQPTFYLTIIGIGLAGWYKFREKGLINYRIGFIIAIPILFGSMLGSNLVLQISEGILKNVIIVLNILIMIFILLNPDMGIEKKPTPLDNHRLAIGALLSFSVGIYGGFYGALAGTFVLYILILWFRLTFIQSAATLKIASVFMTVTAATVFSLYNAVNYALGAAMLTGCLIGSYLGAHYAERIGNVWIKRMFTAFIVIAVIKLILSD